MIASHKDQPVHANGRHVVGIDVGLKNHAAAAITATGRDLGRTITFTNDRTGIERLETQVLKPLNGPKAILIGMEATGHYWMPIYFELKRRGYESIVINPIQTRGKFRTRIRKTKTDQLDARAIARFVLSGEAKAARIPDEDTLALRLQVRHRWRLVDLRGDLERFAYSLVDRIFPEFHDHFCSPLNATGRALLRQIGLAPQALADNPDQVTTLVRKASRNKVPATKISELLEKARTSIGIRQAEAVMIAHLRDTLILIEELEAQALVLDEPPALEVRSSTPVGRATDVPGAYVVDRVDPALMRPQSRASQLAALAVGAREGERILDACAAPGGKSAILAEHAHVTAVEMHPGRAAALAKQHLPGVDVVTADVREVSAYNFDRALVDAPCSGLGVLARRPDLRWRSQPLPELQRELLAAAALRVRPGGVVVYAVCTLNADENEAIVDDSGLEIERLGAEWPQYAHPKRPEFVLTLPHRDHTSGFFIARLRRPL